MEHLVSSGRWGGDVGNGMCESCLLLLYYMPYARWLKGSESVKSEMNVIQKTRSEK